jgi:hypothetical protein
VRRIDASRAYAGRSNMSQREATVQRCGWSAIPEGVIDAGFLSDGDLAVFVELTKHRRSLPVYHGWCWCCYECGFSATDLRAVGRHIMQSHQAAPVDQDQERYD